MVKDPNSHFEMSMLKVKKTTSRVREREKDTEWGLNNFVTYLYLVVYQKNGINNLTLFIISIEGQ